MDKKYLMRHKELQEELDRVIFRSNVEIGFFEDKESVEEFAEIIEKNAYVFLDIADLYRECAKRLD